MSIVSHVAMMCWSYLRSYLSGKMDCSEFDGSYAEGPPEMYMAFNYKLFYIQQFFFFTTTLAFCLKEKKKKKNFKTCFFKLSLFFLFSFFFIFTK